MHLLFIRSWFMMMTKGAMTLLVKMQRIYELVENKLYLCTTPFILNLLCMVLELVVVVWLVMGERNSIVFRLL